MKKISLMLVTCILLLSGCSTPADSSVPPVTTAATTEQTTTSTVSTTSAAPKPQTTKAKTETTVRFTNKHDGVTSKTPCSYPGCPKKVATTGDTCYCTFHSAKCLECGSYIDADALYCIDCILKAFG